MPDGLGPLYTTPPIPRAATRNFRPATFVCRHVVLASSAATGAVAAIGGIYFPVGDYPERSHVPALWKAFRTLPCGTVVGANLDDGTTFPPELGFDSQVWEGKMQGGIPLNGPDDPWPS